MKDCTTPNVAINCDTNPNDDSITLQSSITTPYSVNDDFITDRPRIRKRKRKFTRKIVRPRLNVDQCDVTYDLRASSDFLTSTPRDNCDIDANFVSLRAESWSDSFHHVQPNLEQVIFNFMLIGLRED